MAGKYFQAYLYNESLNIGSLNDVLERIQEDGLVEDSFSKYFFDSPIGDLRIPDVSFYYDYLIKNGSFRLRKFYKFLLRDFKDTKGKNSG